MNKIKAKLSGKKEVARSLTRIAHEIIEKNDNLSETAIVGIRTRGDFLAKRLHAQIEKISGVEIPIGTLDVTFHRDDFRTNLGSPKVGASQILFEIEGKNVILIDDVLYTGRTIRAAMDEVDPDSPTLWSSGHVFPSCCGARTGISIFRDRLSGRIQCIF